MAQKKQRKLPFQQVFWDSYVNHPQLRMCSLAAQGLWPHILRICWEASPRGHFLIGEKPPTMEKFSLELVGKPIDIVQAALAELEANGVFSRTGEGVIYCRRMVNDEARRQAKAGDDLPTPTERELADLAIREQLELAAKDADRKAKQRARTNRARGKKRAASALARMQAFEAMATAAQLSDARAAGDDVTPACVTEGVTVTCQALPVTLHNASENNAVTAVAPIFQTPHPREDITPVTEPDGAAGSLRHPMGGSPAEASKGRRHLRRTPVPTQKPQRSIEEQIAALREAFPEDFAAAEAKIEDEAA